MRPPKALDRRSSGVELEFYRTSFEFDFDERIGRTPELEFSLS